MTDIEDADAGILKAIFGLGCFSILLIAVVAGIVITIIRAWRH